MQRREKWEISSDRRNSSVAYSAWALVEKPVGSEHRKLERRRLSRFRLWFSGHCIIHTIKLYTIKYSVWAKLYYLFLWDFLVFFLPKGIRKEIRAAQIPGPRGCQGQGACESSQHRLQPPSQLGSWFRSNTTLQTSSIRRLSLCFRNQVCLLQVKLF